MLQRDRHHLQLSLTNHLNLSELLTMQEITQCPESLMEEQLFLYFTIVNSKSQYQYTDLNVGFQLNSIKTRKVVFRNKALFNQYCYTKMIA